MTETLTQVYGGDFFVRLGLVGKGRHGEMIATCGCGQNRTCACGCGNGHGAVPCRCQAKKSYSDVSIGGRKK